MKKILRCKENGEFSVLVVADPQCENKTQWQEAEAELETLVKRSSPDLVVIDGDMESNNLVPAEEFGKMIRPLTARAIPFFTINGNHDPFLEETFRLYGSFANCLNEKVDADDENYEPQRPMNLCLPVYSHDEKRIVFGIFGMDTGDYVNQGWDGVTKKQVAWYRAASARLRKEAKAPIPALLCCHIAFAEVNRMQVLDGIAEEVGAVTAKQNDNGLFDAICEQNDVKIAVFGHSHTINRIGVCDGILLGYAGKLSTGSYHNEICRGGRTVVFCENEPKKIRTSWLASLPVGKDQTEIQLSWD